MVIDRHGGGIFGVGKSVVGLVQVAILSCDSTLKSCQPRVGVSFRSWRERAALAPRWVVDRAAPIIRDINPVFSGKQEGLGCG